MRTGIMATIIILFLIIGIFGYMLFFINTSVSLDDSDIKIETSEIKHILHLPYGTNVSFVGTVVSNARLCYLEDNGYVISVLEEDNSDKCKYEIGERLSVEGQLLLATITRVLERRIDIIEVDYNVSRALTIQPNQISKNPSRLIIVKNQILFNTSVVPLSLLHGEPVLNATFEEFSVAIPNSYLDIVLIEGRKYDVHGFVWPREFSPFVHGLKIIPSE